MADAGERVGQQLGNYRLLHLLGRGGFAEVYLGEHVHLGTQAAIKVLYARMDHDGIETFRAEARTIASLEHPSIVRVLDFGVEDNTPFLIMSYAPGGTLRMRYPRGTRLPLVTVVSYVQQISSALQYAHERRLVHRDIKPENLLVGRNNEVLLSDFGIALVAQSSRYQHTQDVAGTVPYMAPEQIQSNPRPASDQYSLGVVVYEWLSGEVPFQGSFIDVAVKHTLMPPPSLREKLPELSALVEQVVFTALAKEPQQRFPTVLAFANALKEVSETTQQAPQYFPMSGATLHQSWQSTYVKTPTGHSLHSTRLNTVSATPIPTPPTLQATPFPNTNLPPAYVNTPIPEAFPPSVNTGKRKAPRSFIHSTRFRVTIIAVVCAVIIAGLVGSFVLSASSQPKVLHTAKLVVDHSIVDFGKIERGAQATLALGLSNTGKQALTWTAEASNLTWLQVQTRSAPIGPGNKELDNLTVDTASLPPGTSSTLLTISSNGGNLQVPVRVEVYSGPRIAILAVSTNSLAFGTVAVASQVTQSIVVSDVGILGLTWKAVVGKASWVTLDRSNGTIQSGGSPQTINMTVQSAGLATGSYSDMVTITSNGGKQSVQVSMMVSSSPLPNPQSPTLSSPAPQPPQLILNVTSLNFGSVSAGKSQSLPLIVQNNGGETLIWNANTGGTSWVTPGTSSGNIQPAVSQTVNVTVNTQGLAPGPRSATLTINSNGGIKQVAITLTVTAATVTPLWVASTAFNNIYTTPAVANGMVYAGSVDHNLYAWNASTGALIWSYTTGNDIYSSPAVVSGVVYVGSDDDKLYALNAGTGAVIWSYTTGNQIRSSPAVGNGDVYVGSLDDKLYALNASTGSVVWSHTTGGPIYSSPAVVNNVVYVGSDDHNLYALGATTGQVLWSYTTGNVVHSLPYIVNSEIYFGSEDGNLYALNISNGAKTWSFTTGGAIQSSPVVDSSTGMVYVASDDHNLYALNANTGVKIWAVTTGDAIHSSPVVSNGVIYIGSNDYKVYALDASTGATRWTYTTGFYVGGKPTVAGGVVYIGSGDDKMYAFTAS